MAATRSQIVGWLREAQENGATHMIVKCDGFGDPMGDCCYPVEVAPDEGVKEVEAGNRDRTMEVYSLTGNHTVDAQMSERRAFHYD